MDGANGPEEEGVDISLTLTQASSLYILCERGIALIDVAIEEIKKTKLGIKGNEDISQEELVKRFETLNEALELNEAIKQDAEWLRAEATNIVKELNPEKPRNGGIILPPNWDNGNSNGA